MGRAAERQGKLLEGDQERPHKENGILARKGLRSRGRLTDMVYFWGVGGSGQVQRL